MSATRRGAQDGLAVAEIAAESDDRGKLHAQTLGSNHSENPVGVSRSGRPRVIVTDTSSNGTEIGAWGLCTVTLVNMARSCASTTVGDAFGDGLDEVDRVALHGRHDLLGEFAVVDGAGEVVDRRGIPGDITVTSITKTCPSRRSWSSTPWNAVARSPVVISSRVHESVRPFCQASVISSAALVLTTSCTRTPHTPAFAARALTIAVASSRSASSAPHGDRNRLREAPTRQRMPGAGQLVEPTQQLPVVLRALREAQARVEDHAAQVDARHDHLAQPRLEPSRTSMTTSS